MSNLNTAEFYERVFGKIDFPEVRSDSRTEELLTETSSNPTKWLVSADAMHWRNSAIVSPANISRLYFREAPAGVCAGLTDDIRLSPGNYLYSSNNGFSWHDIVDENSESSYTWIFHGDHDSLWFKKKS